jgi:hypothetical protein
MLLIQHDASCCSETPVAVEKFAFILAPLAKLLTISAACGARLLQVPQVLHDFAHMLLRLSQSTFRCPYVLLGSSQLRVEIVDSDAQRGIARLN